tara:strand:+ start:125 stop:346 length:222 start_codon:yes stop_codon:yes gene_type:complete
MKLTTNQIYDFILDNEIATEEEINIITNINGYNKKSLNNIIYARTAYNDVQQCVECEPESFLVEESILNIILK